MSVAGMLLPPSRAVLRFCCQYVASGPHLACLPTAGGVTHACVEICSEHFSNRQKSSRIFYTSKVVFEAPSVTSAKGKASCAQGAGEHGWCFSR